MPCVATQPFAQKYPCKMAASPFAAPSAIFNSHRPTVDGRNTSGHISFYDAMAVTTQFKGPKKIA
jgi:hypothetical protein